MPLYCCCFVFPSTNHNIHFNTQEDFLAGQRVFAIGVLVSSPMRTHDGKTLTHSKIKALQMGVLDDGRNALSATKGDRNHVELVGNISSRITRRSDYTSFAVATNYKYEYDSVFDKKN